MAFIPTLPVFRATPCTTSRTVTTMAHAPVSRRAALRLAAFSIAAAATSALAADVSVGDLKELKEDVEELNYEDELLDVGPDAQEKNVTRIKRKTPPPKFRTEEAELLEKEDKKYDDMLAKEREEEARIKAQFSKKD